MDQYAKENNRFLKQAWDDEPIFPILGRDKAATAAILAWVEESIKLGTQPRHKLHEALDLAIHLADPAYRKQFDFGRKVKKFISPEEKGRREPKNIHPEKGLNLDTEF